VAIPSSRKASTVLVVAIIFKRHISQHCRIL
jgi:hypothetical protein